MKESKLSDELYMQRCIELAAKGSKSMDFPFGSLLVHHDSIIAEFHNEALLTNEIYKHAEMLVLIHAQKELSSSQLKKATLYCTVEPCAMCSFAIQELGISRVVFGLRSPIMGGYSKWKILQDEELGATFPNTFGKAPEISPGVLRDSVADGWKKWNPEKWARFLEKGVFT
ncbi:nucleoside deaminase [Patescibacteria group bacterium]|nr:nucleoside deaminase [Patescibacteria group bacterium]